MALTKATYSLDRETLKRLQQLARTWQVSKTEVVRRAIRSAAERELPIPWDKRLEALRALRASMQARGVDFKKWQRESRKVWR